MRWFSDLKYLLPCAECRKHYEALVTSGPLKIRPGIFKNRKTAFTWGVAIHDAVTKRVCGKKPRRTPTQWYVIYNALRKKKS